MRASSDQQREFQARLQRVAERASGHVQTIHVGEDETYTLPRRVRSAPRSGPLAVLINAFYPVSMVLAAALGALGHLAGMLIRFHAMGLQGWSEKPDVDMVVQVILGFGIALIVGHLIALRSSSHILLNLAGAAAGVLFMHNLVHLYPEIATRLTSPLWVSRMLAATKPHSLLWMGISFPL